MAKGDIRMKKLVKKLFFSLCILLISILFFQAIIFSCRYKVFAAAGKPSIVATPIAQENYIHLEWAAPDNVSPSTVYNFRVHKIPKFGDTQIDQTIALKKNISVLNIYPNAGDNLQAWMNSYGQIPSQNMTMNVNKVSIDNFNAYPNSYLKSADGTYSYDVIYFGGWDANNNKDLSEIAKNAVVDFVNTGRGCILGHDTASFNHTYFINLASTFLGMKINYPSGNIPPYGDSKIVITKKGNLMNYPWLIGEVGTVLNVPLSHSYYEFATTDVWFKYQSGKFEGTNIEVTSYQNFTGTNNFYLTTLNNVAMIQTGHSNGAASVDEQKILANTIYNLAQITTNKNYGDYSSQDVTGPNAVKNIKVTNGDQSGNVNISFDAAVDNGSTYEYKVESIDPSNQVLMSDSVQATIAVGIKGYAVSCDQSPTGDPGNNVNTQTPSLSKSDLTAGKWYVHVKAIDNANNVSDNTTMAFYYQNTAPVVTLKGNSTVNLNLGEAYQDAGATATDSVEGDISSSIQVTGADKVNTKVSGTYNIDYQVSNSSGIKSTIVTRKVVVAPAFSAINISATTTGGNYSGGWVDKPITFTASSGINSAAYKKYQYTFTPSDANSWSDMNGDNKDNLVINTSQNSILYFRVIAIDDSASVASDGIAVKYDDVALNLEVTNNPAIWTNKDVSLGLKPTVGVSGITSFTVSKDNAAPIDISGKDSYVVSSNGKYVFTLTNGLNANLVKEVDVAYIDKVAPTDMRIVVKDRSFTTLSTNSAFNLFYNSDVQVTLSAVSENSGINYYEYQAVDINNGDKFNEQGGWIRGGSFLISSQFKGNVYARALDEAGNVSAIVSSDGFIYDVTPSVGPTINATVDNATYSGNWTAKNINILLAGGNSLSGVASYQYKIGSDGTWQNMTLKSGVKDAITGNTIFDSLSFTTNINDLVYFRAVSNSGVSGSESSLQLKRDDVVPSIAISYTGIINSWTTNTIKFNLSNATNNIAPINYYFSTNAVDFTKIDGNSYSVSGNINNRYVFKAVSDAGLENLGTSNYVVQIDNTVPEIRGAMDGSSYYIGRNITVADAFGEIASVTYKKNQGPEAPFTNNTLFSDVGGYSLTVTDKAGNSKTIGFTINAMPREADVIYTSAYKNLIQGIRDEFNSHNDLPEPYKTNTDNAIKVLQNKYASFETPDSQVIAIKVAVSSIPKLDNGLIAQKQTVQNLLANMAKLSSAQIASLTDEISILNSLLDRISTLEDAVATVKTAIGNLPDADKVTAKDGGNINKAFSLYNALNAEQKGLVGKVLADKLNSVSAALKQKQLTDTKSGVIVGAVGDTTFSKDTNIVVKEVKASDNAYEFNQSNLAIKNASLSIPELKNKELVALYDVNLFNNNMTVEPNGKVEVQIDIPDSIKTRKNLSVVHLYDEGNIKKVITINATVKGDKLVFITDHFSRYGIVAAVDTNYVLLVSLIILGVVAVATVIFVGLRYRKRLILNK